MAQQDYFPPPKRTCKNIDEIGENYNSDDDYNWSEDGDLTTSTIGDFDSESEGTDFGSNSSMDFFHCSIYDTILLGKDGTRWREVTQENESRPEYSSNIVGHLPTCTSVCDGIKSLKGNLNKLITT